MDRRLSKSGASPPVRTFLAVDLPPDVKETLIRLTGELAPVERALKIVNPDAMHVTVRFLGNVDADRVPLVCEAAEMAAADIAPFTLSLAGLGTFPDGRVPRVIWAGFKQDEGFKTLQRLFDLSELALAARGFGGEERRFSPHLTIARVRDHADRSDALRAGEIVRHLTETREIQGNVPVRDLVVYKSELGRTGPHYSVLGRADLGQVPTRLHQTETSP